MTSNQKYEVVVDIGNRVYKISFDNETKAIELYDEIEKMLDDGTDSRLTLENGVRGDGVHFIKQGVLVSHIRDIYIKKM